MATRFRLHLCSGLMVMALVLGSCSPAPGDAATAPPPVATQAPSTSGPVLVEPKPNDEGATTPGGTPNVGMPTDWQTYTDNIFGFRLGYPADWKYKVQEMGGSGMPDDWPVKAALIFFPEELAEAMNHEGPPDPNAPPAIPPFSVEVVVGSMEALRRVYPEPGRTDEGMVINGASVVVERDTYEDFNTVRYIATHPGDPNVRVVLLDVISGFKDRAAANPEAIEVIRRAVSTLEFTGETPVVEPISFAPVTIVEADLTVEVPKGWERRMPDWIWDATGEQSPWVGVRWVDLQPPQEPEAALLPENAQILDSEEADLTWAKGRIFTLEVYESAAQGGDAQAPAVSMEQHLVVVMTEDGGRRAYDFFAAAENAEALEGVMPVYHHLLGSISWGRAQENALDGIRQALAARFGMDANFLDLVLQEFQFPDACLGAPAEGEVCAQVLTPGYSGTLRVGEKDYEVRASLDGQRVLVCDNGVCSP